MQKKTGMCIYSFNLISKITVLILFTTDVKNGIVSISSSDYSLLVECQ